MFKHLRWVAVLLASLPVMASAGYLDEDPDEVFAAVYERLGALPLKAARDPFVWLRLEELKREPCDQKSISDYALALDKLGYRREAANSLVSFVRHCGAPTSALHRAADIYLKLTDYERAAETADEFVRREPSNSSAYYVRALALDGVGDRRRAIADYSNAIELWGSDKKGIGSGVFVRMASAYAALGQFCEAAVPIATWMSFDPVGRDTSRTRKIIDDYEQRGDCAVSAEFRKERFALHGQQQVVTVKAEINGVPGTFIFDTGASYVSVRTSFAERAKIPTAGASEITLATANGQVKAKLSKADKVTLGKLEAKGVPVAIQEVDGKSYGTGVDGLLGMTFLSRFEIQVAKGFVEVRTRNQKK